MTALQAARARWQWPAALVACVLATGFASVHLGLDVNWDLRNYHYYDAYAFHANRLGWDVAPAQIQTYYNPLADLAFYALVQEIPSPRVIAFVMALPAGIALFLLLRLLARLFPATTPDRALWIAAAFAIGATGSAGRAVLGCTMNEWPPAMLLMVALTCHPRGDGDPARTLTRLGWAPAFAGVTMGMAVGLKLTYGVYAAGFLVATLAASPSWRTSVRETVILGASLFAGFLVTYGFWGLTLWREFGNPFFPYFNDVFQSPWWEPISWLDRNYGPRDGLQLLFFPFYFARESSLVAEVAFRDYRLAALMALVLILPFSRALSTRPSRLAPPWKFLSFFALGSYISWLLLFGIYRYLVPLEMLAGPLIVAALLALIPGANARRVVIVAVAVLLVATTRPGTWGRTPFHGAYLDVAAPDLPPHALVIVGPFDPLAYAIPFFRPDARFVSPFNNFLHWSQHNLLAKRVDTLVRTHAGPIYTLDLRGYDRLGGVLGHYALARDLSRCLPVRSNLDFGLLQVCPVSRQGS